VVSGFCEEIVAEAVVNWGGFETIKEVIRGIKVEEAAVKGVGESVAFEVIGAEEAGVKKKISGEEEQEGCYAGGTLCQAVFMEVGVVIGAGQQGGGGRHCGEVSDGGESQC
jgi:hypothetical protein